MLKMNPHLDDDINQEKNRNISIICGHDKIHVTSEI